MDTYTIILAGFDFPIEPSESHAIETEVHDPSASSGNLLPPHVAGLMAAGDCGLHSSKCCCLQENTIHQSVLLSFHMLQAR